jgi:FixJ family two-component response regulator
MKGSRYLIAVVDDDPSVLRAVAHFLTSSGLDVATFSSAIEYLDDPYVRPACLVTDVQMPGMSGLDLKQHLARSERDLPVIFVTGHDDPQTRARAVTLGAEGFFRKPFDVDELLEAIVKVIGIDLCD